MDDPQRLSEKTSSQAHKFGLWATLDRASDKPLPCSLQGLAVLRDPYVNKGTAFTDTERKEFKLLGLLPPIILTLEEQVEQAYQQFNTYTEPAAKTMFLSNLKSQNIVLFYKLVSKHLEEMFPVLYAPRQDVVVADCAAILRQSEGCFLDIDHMEKVEEILRQWTRPEDIDIIVVTDGEQLLDIDNQGGDQGVGGIVTSVAKLVQYTLCAGIHPKRTLAVVLDCGTNNQRLLQNKMYAGLKKTRATGEKYEEFINHFLTTAKKVFPSALLHFEDFSSYNSWKLLQNREVKMPALNDDMQGSGAIVVGAIQAALQITKVPFDKLRVVIFGAGCAGTGIADQLCVAISICSNTEMSLEEAAKHVWCVDKHGVCLQSTTEHCTLSQKPYAHPDSEYPESGRDLLSVVRAVKPHVLIGTSKVPGAFTREVVETMVEGLQMEAEALKREGHLEAAEGVVRPIIFPLSNPSWQREAAAENLLTWTKGKALIVTGEETQTINYKDQNYVISECTNSLIIPGIGLGTVLSGPRLIKPELLLAASLAIADKSPSLKGPNKGLLPRLDNVLEVSADIATAVIEAAVHDHLATKANLPDGPHGTDDESLRIWRDTVRDWVEEQMWTMDYQALKYQPPIQENKQKIPQLGGMRLMEAEYRDPHFRG